MKTLLLATVLVSALGAGFAQGAAAAAGPKPAIAACDSCGTVQSVRQIRKDGKTSGIGMVGGAVVGGVLGNQIGGGTGRTLATIGGAAAGGYVGNKLEQKHKSRTVWVTAVRMPDGRVRTFEQEGKPFWKAGTTVRVNGNRLEKP